MKKKCKILCSILFYILLLSWAMDFQFARLLDVKLFLQHVIGTVILTLPFCHKKMTKAEYAFYFGKKAIEAGYIQTFLLLFSRLADEKGYEALLSDIAMAFRPVLYGFCFFLLLREQEQIVEKQEDAIIRQEEQKTAVSYEHFLEIGLTKREAEIAILISKVLSNREIAEEFVISEATVKKHVSNIFEKTGIEKREEVRFL